MAKILDFLVEYYTYVAAISGFLIIALIGFLVKDKNNGEKKPKKEKPDKKVVEENKEDETTIETKDIDESTNDNMNTMDIVEPLHDNIEPMEETNIPIEPQISIEEGQPNIDISNVEISPQKYQVKLDTKPDEIEPEIFKLEDTLVLDRRKLDDEVDIINFDDLNKFESTNEAPKPIEKE